MPLLRLVFVVFTILSCLGSLALDPDILVSIIGNKMVYYHLDTEEVREINLSDNLVNQTNCRSFDYDKDRCVFYALTDFRSTPKLYEISIDGTITFIADLSDSQGRTIYSCEGIAYNPEDQTLYASISIGFQNYYTYEIADLNISNAVCTTVTEISTTTPKGPDVDAMDNYKGKLVLLDGDPQPFHYVHILDISNAGTTSYPSEVFQQNALLGIEDVAVSNDYLYGLTNGNLIRADLRNASLTFSTYKDFSDITMEVAAMASFDNDLIFERDFLPSDTSICSNATFSIAFGDLENFIWSDGQEGDRVLSQAGLYTGRAKSGACLFSPDSILLSYKPCDPCEMLKEDWNAYLTLGQDQTLCVGDTFYLQLDLNADSILWSNGDVGTESAIYSNSDIWAGIYKDSCLLYTDTLNIRFVNCTNCTVHLPNAFSPNGDDLNDTFRPVPAEGCIYNFYRLRIYSFWGEKLLDSDEGFWDGIYLGEVVENGPYVVLLEFSNDITEVPYIAKTVVYVVR